MTTAKKTPAKNAMLEKLNKLSSAEKTVTTPVIQKVVQVEPPKRVGRKNHKIEGLKYVRISPALPADLKKEMDVAIKTTHEDTPTIDTFVISAVRAYLDMRK